MSCNFMRNTKMILHQYSNLLILGSDVEDIYIDKVMIASVPQKGKLFSIPLGGVPSKPISAGSSMGFRSQCIHYVYEGDKKGDENGQVDTDSFLFYVKDSEGFCSKNYTMDISIKSPIITGSKLSFLFLLQGILTPKLKI